MSQALQCAGFVDNELLFIMVEARSPRNPIQARLYLHFFGPFLQHSTLTSQICAIWLPTIRRLSQVTQNSQTNQCRFRASLVSLSPRAHPQSTRFLELRVLFFLALSQSAHHYHLCHHLYLHYLPLIRMFAGKNVSHLLFAFSKRY